MAFFSIPVQAQRFVSISALAESQERFPVK
jgi:hypothetical protein